MAKKKKAGAIPLSRMTARQLHKYVDNYNWDDGTAKMLLAIRSKQCDLGTALMVYWRCDPRYYYEAIRTGDKDALRYGEGWPVMRAVLAKIERGGFKSADCSFNPENDRGTNWTKGKPSLKTLGIPEITCQPVRNGRVDSRIGGLATPRGR